MKCNFIPHIIIACALGCPRNYNPVCASDGRVYNNECTLNVQNQILGQSGENIHKVHNGVCESKANIYLISSGFTPVLSSAEKCYLQRKS